MRNNVAMSDSVRCLDRFTPVADDVRVEGVLALVAEDRATGKRRVLKRWNNTVTTAGKGHFLDVISDKSNDLMNQNVKWRIKDGGGSVLYTLSADGAPVHGADATNSDPKMTWTFPHRVSDAYTIGSVEILSPAGIVFATAGSPFADNSKDSSENWIYTYTFIVRTGGGAPFHDGVSGPWEGFALLTEMLDGTHSDDLSETTELHLKDSGGTSVGTKTANGAPARGSDGTHTWLEWVFTAGTSELNVDWDTVAIQTGLGNERIRQRDENLGTKTSSAERELTYRFRVAL